MYWPTSAAGYNSSQTIPYGYTCTLGIDYSRNESLFFFYQVLYGRQLQIKEQIEQNRQAQRESLQSREELIRELEDVRQLTSRAKKEDEEQKTARKLELETQVT